MTRVTESELAERWGITTRTLRAQHTAAEAVNYMGGSDTYPQYCAAVSAMPSAKYSSAHPSHRTNT